MEDYFNGRLQNGAKVTAYRFDESTVLSLVHGEFRPKSIQSLNSEMHCRLITFLAIPGMILF